MPPAPAFVASPGRPADHAAHRFSGAGLACVVAAHIAVVGGLVASHAMLPEPVLLAARMVQVISLPAPVPAAATTPRPAPVPRTPAPQLPTPVLAHDHAAAAPVIPAMAAAPAAKDPAPAAVPAASESPPTPQAVQAPRFDADYLHNPAPVYPALARRLREEGRVVLRVLVEPTGHASQMEVKTGSGSPRLDQAAQDAVWRWKFVPARRGDEAVGAWVLVPLVFSLKG